jgi:hypothetical protein
MNLYSYLTDKVTLGKRIAELPQYKEAVRRYVRLLEPDADDTAIDGARATVLLKECLYNNASPKKAAVILVTNDFGRIAKHWDVIDMTFEHRALYLANMLALKKALEGSGDDTPYV